VAAGLGLSALGLAEGIVAVANALMADAIREVTVARGIDPRDFDLLAFGGAGPLHAVALAEELEIARVVVPAGPGTLSAWGMLQASIRHDFVRAFFRDLETVEPDDLRAVAAELRESGEAALRDDGVDAGRVRCDASADLRYRGQEYTLNVPLPHDGDTAALAQRFTDAHHARYGHSNPSERIEVVNLRVAALGAGDPLPADPLAADLAPAPEAVVEAVFDGTTLATPLYARAALGTGSDVTGPCIVLEEGCTTLVPPGWHATTTPDGHVLLERE